MVAELLKKILFSADIHQICGKKSRLAAVLSRNRFETYVFKLNIYFKQWNAQNAALFGSSSTAADIPRTFANACHHLFSWSVKAQVTCKEKFQGRVISEKTYIFLHDVMSQKCSIVPFYGDCANSHHFPFPVYFGPLWRNWRAQSKNDPLIFRPFLKVFRSSWILACGHFQKWAKNQGIVLALSPPIAHA